MTRTEAGGEPLFEIWADGRLHGRCSDAWIDKLDIDVVGDCAEMIGASLLFGKNRGISSCSQTERADAVSAGFPVLAACPDHVLKFFESLRYGEGADQDRPQGRYGRIHDWLKRGGGSSGRFEPVRAILRNHILETWPLGNDELTLDERVKERRFHSLQSAAKYLDAHPKRLGKQLEAEGHLDLGKSGPDRLIPAWVISAMRDAAFEDAGLAEATEILGVSKFTIETLLEAGILRRATTGEGMRSCLDRASVRDFSSWIAALPEGDGQTGRDIRSVCRLFHMIASDILGLAKTGKLHRTIRLIGRIDYHAIRILPQAIEALSGGRLRPMLGLYQTAKNLKINFSLLEKIIESGYLTPENRSPKNGIGAIPMIAEVDIIRFMEEYVMRRVPDMRADGDCHKISAIIVK